MHTEQTDTKRVEHEVAQLRLHHILQAAHEMDKEAEVSGGSCAGKPCTRPSDGNASTGMSTRVGADSALLKSASHSGSARTACAQRALRRLSPAGGCPPRRRHSGRIDSPWPTRTCQSRH